MRHLADRHVLVLGLGQSGLAMARWCAGHGAQVTVWDSREAPPQAEALRAECPAVALVCGALEADQLAGIHMVLKSPGLAPGDERIAGLLAAARATGVRIDGELGLFTQALADLKAERGYAPKVIAITGTNGKTTTTAMAAALIERTGRRVAAAGNIGPTMLDTLAQALALEPAPIAEEAAGQDAACAQGDASAAEPATVELAPADHARPVPEPDVGEGAIANAAAATQADDPDSLEVPLPPRDDAADVAADAEADATTDAATDAATDASADAAPLQLAPPPPAAPVFEHLPEVWVLELSSFQLDGVQGFEPDAAAVLNVSQDHLDWHGSMNAYAEAKARIFGQQAVMVVNRDDLRIEAMVPAPVMVKGGRGRPAKAVGRKVLRFGLDAPQRPGDYGLITEGGMAWLVRALEADETIKRRHGDEEEIHLQRLMPADALRVRGRHNAANALAALALAGAIGCPLAPMLHGLRDYRGEPHRVAFIGSVGGVEAFDDSKGTNVGATVAALEGLGADKAPAKIVVILGGDGKGQDFSPLAAAVTRHARAVALIGRDAPAIEAVLFDSGVPLQRQDTLPEAVAWCFSQAQSGDAVLLSPACASFDMFRHYGHRAEVFVQAVQALAADRGEALS